MPKNTVFYNWFDYIIWGRIVNGVVDGNMCRAFWVLSGSFSGQHWVAHFQVSEYSFRDSLYKEVVKAAKELANRVGVERAIEIIESEDIIYD